MRTKQLESIIEAILFTMGDSVEVSKIASAIEQDVPTTEKLIHNMMDKYQKAISVTDHYCETKNCFTWIGEIENERLLAALENLSDADLNLVTMYAYEGYTVTEISKVLGVAQPTISIKIKRITKFLKNFNFNAMD